MNTCGVTSGESQPRRPAQWDGKFEIKTGNHTTRTILDFLESWIERTIGLDSVKVQIEVHIGQLETLSAA